MKAITFDDKSTQKVYDSYIKRIARTTAGLLPEDKEDIMMEFNSHIYESLQINQANSELDNLLNAIESLGEPEEVLQTLVADKTLEKATRTFNPVTVIKAVALNIGNGFSYILFAVLYLFLLAFVFLIGAKIVFPSEVGMFFRDGQFFVLGMTSRMNEPNVTEALGALFIPIMLCGASLLYFLITLALRLKRKK